MQVRAAFSGIREWSAFPWQDFKLSWRQESYVANVMPLQINVENVKVDNQPVLKSYTGDEKQLFVVL